ncbi:hypothetical protein P886_1329 [Alteromonadaceae bacterium 2753L.S.0a.02]|nr:hypothetical protein P886_1329 [Alteromonadaceae bacterium 2753L.S.0a.02]
MKNIFVGAVLGVIALLGVQFLAFPKPETVSYISPRPTSGGADTTRVVSASNPRGQVLSEQQLRKVIQEEIQATLTAQLSVFSKEIVSKQKTQAGRSEDLSEADSVNKHTTNTIVNRATYQTARDIVDVASAEGYFSEDSLAELKTHYKNLSDSQKFQIDAKIADSMNNGNLEFDESLFINLP